VTRVATHQQPEAEVGSNTCKISNFKKGRIGRLMLTTLDLWKSEV
jgi:hypothetical protein